MIDTERVMLNPVHHEANLTHLLVRSLSVRNEAYSILCIQVHAQTASTYSYR